MRQAGYLTFQHASWLGAASSITYGAERCDAKAWVSHSHVYSVRMAANVSHIALLPQQPRRRAFAAISPSSSRVGGIGWQAHACLPHLGPPVMETSLGGCISCKLATTNLTKQRKGATKTLKR